MKVAKFSRIILDEEIKLVGTYSENPMLNTLMYDVQLPDGATKAYAANMVAQNIYNSVDYDGRQYRPFGQILNYYKTANAVMIAGATAVGRNGQRY